MGKTTSKTKKKTQGKKQGSKIVSAILVIATVLIGGYFVIKYYPMGQEEEKRLVEVTEELRSTLPTIVEGDIELPLYISGYEEISINWETSDDMMLSSLGKVNQPSYLEGDKAVTLTARFVVSVDDPLKEMVFNLFGINSKTVVFEVIIKCLAISDQEKVDTIKSGIYLPQTTSTDIGLLYHDAIFNSVAINWSTTNTDIMTATGIKKGTGDVTLTVNLISGEINESIDYNIKVTDDEPEIVAVDMDFDNMKTGTYSTIWELDGWIFTGAILAGETDNQTCRMKAESPVSASIETADYISNPSQISFEYEIVEADKKTTYTKDTFVSVYYMNDDENWHLLATSAALGSLKYEFLLDTSGLGQELKFKIELSTAYASMRVDFDNIIIKRDLIDEDFTSWLNKNIPSTYFTSTVFPLSTEFGGVITWSSDSNALTKDGVVTKGDNSVKVVLTATIKGFGEDIIIPLSVTVKGKNSVTPVEIYFIDIGKYGQSDCGESMYIKFADIDILIDAGDDITATKQAIKEVIDSYSSDKIIEYVIATHPDADHIGGMTYIFETYEIENLIQFSGDHTTTLYKNYKAAYENEECSVCTALDSYNNVGSCKQKIVLGDDVFLEILNTNNYLGEETNTRSVVFVLDAYGVRTLFTGDADNGSNSNLESEYMNTVGNIDILKAVHHATREGTTIDFLEAVDPEVVIITNGNYFGNKNGHPTFEAINRIYEYDDSITIYAVVGGDSEDCAMTDSGSYKCDSDNWMVDRNGTIKVTIDNAGYTITSEYYEDSPLELSSTEFWENNPGKLYEYSK